MTWPLVRKSKLVGGLRLGFVKDLMEEFGVKRAYVAGHIIRIRKDGSMKVKPATADAISDFVDRLVRGEKVLIIDHGYVFKRTANGFLAGFRLPVDISLAVEIPNPLDPDINPELDQDLFEYEEDPDFDDVNRYLQHAYVLFAGTFKPSTKAVRRKTKKKIRIGRGEVEFLDPVVRELPKIPKLVLLFMASGFFELTEDGKLIPFRETASELSEEDIDRILGLEVLRRFGRFGPALTLQLSQPGHGKSSFYKAVLRYFDSVEVFSTPPGKSILYLDERYKPPAPGAIFTKDVVVLDEVGERARKHREERGVVDIRPKVKESFDEPGVARVAVLSNVFDSRAQPVVTATMTAREALSNVLAKTGIRQVEGRAERLVMAITTRGTDLHGKRKRSDRTLDPKIYRRFKREYDLLDDRPRSRTHRFQILKDRIQELGAEVDEEILIVASNPLKLASGTSISRHQKAIEEVGRAVREAIERRLQSLEDEEEAEEETSETGGEFTETETPKEAPEEKPGDDTENPFGYDVPIKEDAGVLWIEV